MAKNLYNAPCKSGKCEACKADRDQKRQDHMEHVAISLAAFVIGLGLASVALILVVCTLIWLGVIR